MARRSQNSDTSVSLFPFLAVLVCAMGALIFLLLVTVKQIREQAIAKSQSPKAEVEITGENDGMTSEVVQPEPLATSVKTQPIPVTKPAEIPTAETIDAVPVEPDDFPIAEDVPIKLPAKSDAELIAEAERIRQRLIQEQQDELDADWSKRISKLNSEIEEAKTASNKTIASSELLAKSLEQKKSVAESLSGKVIQANSELLQDKQELDKVETESLAVIDDIQQLRQKLEDAKKAKKQASSRFRLIPYDGITGTTRRPIFIECNSKGLQFQPENVTISAADVQGFSTYYNPVLIGTRALVHFWRKFDARNGSPGKPYVLLVVKPEGTMAFYAARKLLSELRIPYGYELVESEFPLDYPVKNDDAEEALKKAIVDVLRQRNKVASSILGDGDGSANERGRGFPNPDSTSPLGNKSTDPFGNGRSRLKEPAQAPTRLGQSQKAGSKIGQFPKVENASTKPTGTRGFKTNAEKQNSAKSSQGEFPEVEPLPQISQRATNDTTERSRLIPPSPNRGQESTSEYRVKPQFPSPGSSTGASSSSFSDASESAFNNKQQWGVQNQSAKIGIEKTVRIQIEPHQITVGNLKPLAVGKGESADQLQEEVLKRIEQYARSWGAPPRSFYWSPYLKCEISPGGNRHFDRIERRFRQLNLKTVAEPVFTARPDFFESIR